MYGFGRWSYSVKTLLLNSFYRFIDILFLRQRLAIFLASSFNTLKCLICKIYYPTSLYFRSKYKNYNYT